MESKKNNSLPLAILTLKDAALAKAGFDNIAKSGYVAVSTAAVRGAKALFGLAKIANNQLSELVKNKLLKSASYYTPNSIKKIYNFLPG